MIKMKVVNLTAQNRQRMVWLQSHDDEMMLPIIIGDAEAIAISFELAGKQMSRPLTHDLLKSILEQFDAQVERVDIVDLKEEIFYAELVISLNGEELRLDARPSDSIALALKYDAPVYISEEVLNMAGGKVRTAKSGVAYFEKLGDDSDGTEFEIEGVPLDDTGLENAVRDLITAAQIDEEDAVGEDGTASERLVYLRDQIQRAIKEERYEDAGEMKEEIERLKSD